MAINSKSSTTDVASAKGMLVLLVTVTFTKDNMKKADFSGKYIMSTSSSLSASLAAIQ